MTAQLWRMQLLANSAHARRTEVLPYCVDSYADVLRTTSAGRLRSSINTRVRAMVGWCRRVCCLLLTLKRPIFSAAHAHERHIIITPTSTRHTKYSLSLSPCAYTEPRACAWASHACRPSTRRAGAAARCVQTSLKTRQKLRMFAGVFARAESV